jgi:hypothetical protein
MCALVPTAEDGEQRDESHKRGYDSHHDEQGVEAHATNSSATWRSRKQETSSSCAAVRMLNGAFHRISLLSRFRTCASSAAVHAATQRLRQLPA